MIQVTSAIQLATQMFVGCMLNSPKDFIRLHGVNFMGLHAHFNPIALRKGKIVHNFGLSECSIGLMHIYKRGNSAWNNF